MIAKIVDAARNKDKILRFDCQIHCQHCGEKQFSPFDKLYTYSYDKCVDCSTPEELDNLGDNIFAIL